MKKLFCTLLAAVFVCLCFSGCEVGEKAKLRICFDMGRAFDLSLLDGKSQQEEAVEKFLSWLDDCAEYMDYGISSEDVEVEIIPSDESLSTEREAALQRVRTEIMSGGGPDVFICATAGETVGLADINEAPDSDRLFPYVDKAIEEGYFLPLDDYMERAVLTIWDDMISTVMDGGKNSAGEQVVLPMTFLLPTTMFHQNEMSKIDYEGRSWKDVLAGDDPTLNHLAGWPFQQSGAVNPAQSNESGPVDLHTASLFCIYPNIANYKTGELAFTEEELINRIKESISAYQKAHGQEQDVESSSSFMNTQFSSSIFGRGPTGFSWEDKNISLLPLPNEKGGATALISLWCAVNANTKRAEDAFAVADAALCESNQKGGYLYCLNAGMPTDKKALEGETHRFGGGTRDPHSLTTQQYEEWLRACGSVTAVRYPSALDAELSAMMEDIQKEMFNSCPGIDPEKDRYLYASPLFIEGEISDEKLAEIVHTHYQKMERMLDES